MRARPPLFVSLLSMHLSMCVMASWVGSARADAVAPLRLIPEATARAYAPALGKSEIAVLESDAAGHHTQIAVMAFIAAPPEVVHDIVVHPEEFSKFVRNVSKSDVVRRPDGAIVNTWRVEIPIGHFDGQNEIRTSPGAAGPVDVRAINEGVHGVYRWEFWPVAGGGTLMVHTGHYDGFRQNALLSKMLARNPSYEAGMALSAALPVVKGIQAEAKRRAKRPVAEPKGMAPGFGALLDRGMVTVIRSDAGGHLVDVSVVDRVAVPLDRMLSVVRSPETWPTFLSSVKGCEIVKRDATGLEYRMEIEAVLLDVESLFRMRFIPRGVDVLATAGDVAGSRYRWDLSPEGRGTIAVYRANARLGESSRIMKLMFGFEPYFEHSANVAVGVIAMRAMSRRALTLSAK